MRASRRMQVQSNRRRERWIIVACGAALSLGAGALSIRRPDVLARLDNLWLDTVVTQEHRTAECLLPTIVGIDDEALQRFGHWPWSRSLFGRLLDGVTALGPRCVGIDVIFPEPELSSDSGAPTISEGESALAASLARGPYVLGWEATFAPAGEPIVNTPGPRSVGITSRHGAGLATPARGLWEASGAVSTLPELMRSVDSSGFLNAGFDPDGILRRIPVLIGLGGEVYPSLGLATVLKALGIRQAVLESTPSGSLTLAAGDRRIPLDSKGRILLRYRCRDDDSTRISAAAVLEGRVPAGAVEGKVVFIGATASGLGESIATSIAPDLPGVAAHAIAAANILERDFARQGSALLAAAAVLGLGLAGTMACMWLRALPGTFVLAIAVVGAWLGSGWLFRASGVAISPVLAVVTLSLDLVILTLTRVFQGERRSHVQSRDLAATRSFVAESLASLAAIRDTETGAHILRTQRYLRILCEAAARNPRFRDELTPGTIELISQLAPIHDIGKVGVPDELLHKPSRLTAEEFEVVKRHVAHGRDAINKAEARVGAGDMEFLRVAKDLVYSHHERWDGAGYPEGLSGEGIPLAGRLMAIADVYDSLVTPRVYKEALPHDEAVRIIRDERGRQFDPDLVDAFLGVEHRWREIHRELSDPSESPTPGPPH